MADDFSKRAILQTGGRLFRAEGAAAYLSMSRSTFLRLVDEGKLPKPVRLHGIVAWDRHDLDGAIEDLKDQKTNTMRALLKKKPKKP